MEAIDLARGIAVTLMILSHGVKGLLSFEQIPDWGMVPIHLITKISSSLFFLVFGVSLAVIALPAAGTADWPRRRRKLLLRALAILFAYKVLTVVEMSHLHPPAEILGALAYQGFPVYSEILGFYGLCLLWLPFALPIWKRLPLSARLSSPATFAFASWLLQSWDFEGNAQLKAVLVEQEGYYTWGQVPRMAIVAIGLLLGDWVRQGYSVKRSRWGYSAGIAFAGLAMLGVFWARHAGDLYPELMAIARNQGKHPPDLNFVLFSVGGALVAFGATLAGGDLRSRVLAPVRLIGSDALQAFVFHISVLFVGYRYLLGFWNQVSYTQALVLTAILFLGTALWIRSLHWFRNASARA
ncbi:MAG: heparan-alpha-glucosaminide N-acetyltransferase domain-containing protein [Oligoflexia bacterium]|nr:heparan-alpha-glucosaminide N-acetyltransferase domain-containing protein [Oligoflexia bacterium]